MPQDNELQQIKQILVGIEITVVGVAILILGIGYVSTALLGVGLLMSACGVGYTVFRTIL